jgi:hypothetical protein
VQTWLGAPGEQHQYARSRLVATDAAALPEISKAELAFNPAFQTLTLHEATVWRDGAKLDRLQDARVELLRREERLEQSTLTGTRSLLVVLNDVRVGDAVDVAYTVHGANPIFKGRFADNLQVAFGSKADVVHVRIEHPAERMLRAKGIRADVQPELRTLADGRRSLRIVRRDVPMVQAEEQVPPWFKVWPSVHLSEYSGWDEVARWADELFADTGPLGDELEARLSAWRSRSLPPDRLIAEVAAMCRTTCAISAPASERARTGRRRRRAPGPTGSATARTRSRCSTRCCSVWASMLGRRWSRCSGIADSSTTCRRMTSSTMWSPVSNTMARRSGSMPR